MCFLVLINVFISFFGGLSVPDSENVPDGIFRFIIVLFSFGKVWKRRGSNSYRVHYPPECFMKGEGQENPNKSLNKWSFSSSTAVLVL